MTRPFLTPFLMLAVFAFSATAFAQRTNNAKTVKSEPSKTAGSEVPRPFGGPMGSMMQIFEQAKNEDGKVEIEKVVTLFGNDFQKRFAEADANGDNFLDSEEMKNLSFFNGPSGNRPGGGPSMRDPLADAKTEDGQIDLSKLPEQMPERFREILTNADTDNDGFLSTDEQSKLPFMNRRPGGMEGPGGGMRPPMRDPLADAKTEDGQVDLSKLPEQMPERFREMLTNADTDNDGFLSTDEQNELPFMNRRPGGADSNTDRPRRDRASRNEDRRPPRGRANRNGERGPEGRPPRGMELMGAMFEARENAKTEDGTYDIAKWSEGLRSAQEKFLKDADTNQDGLLDEDELKAMIPQRPRPDDRPARGGNRRDRSRTR